MATTTIPWGDGSGGNIYLTYPSASGDQTVSVSSDANTGAARSKVVTFTSGVGSIVRQLTVNQAAGAITPVFYNYLYFDGTAYVDTDIIPGSLNSYRVSLGKETLKAAQRIFALLAGTSYNIATLLNPSTSSSRRYFSIYYGATGAVSTTKYLAFTSSTYSFYLTPNGFGWGTVYNTITRGSFDPTGPLVLGSNAGHTGQAYTGRMGIFRIYGSDAQNVNSNDGFNSFTPLHTLRPCTYNGEAGFWYVEGSKFFGNNAGAGTLTASDS